MSSNSPYMTFGVNTSIPPPPVSKKVSAPTLMENTNPDVSLYIHTLY